MMDYTIDYTETNGVLLPNFALVQTNYEIGFWGRRYLEHIKQHHKPFYTSLMVQCKLNEHLHNIDVQADELYRKLVSDLAKQQGVTEQLKAEDMMTWVQKMNNITNQARELVIEEIFR